MVKVKTKTRPRTPPSQPLKVTRRKDKVEQQEPKGTGLIWLIVFLLIAAAMFPAAAAHFGSEPREEVVPTPAIEPTSLPLSSPQTEAEVEPTAEPTAEPTTRPSAVPAVIPTVVPTSIPIVSWESAVNLFLLTGLREEEALKAAGEIARLNPDWASGYAASTQETLAAYYHISSWELEKYQRFAKLASALDPSYQEKIQSEMKRLAQEVEATQKAEAEQQIPEPETPEKVEVNLVPPMAIPFPGRGISPESFRLAYNSLRKIPAESKWIVKSAEVIASFQPFFNLIKIVFERDPSESGNPRQTWFVGAFLGKVKVGDKVTGKWLWSELFP